jgi:pimeloyl-ACP methyl ester carboxylesterase
MKNSVFYSQLLKLRPWVITLGLGLGFMSSCAQESPSSAEAASSESGSEASQEEGSVSAPGFEKFTSSCSEIPGVKGDPGLTSDSRATVKYCIYQNSPTPKSTIWFFHGLGDDQNVFIDPQGSRISYRHFMEQVSEVRIVAISYGLLWMLTPSSVRTQEPQQGTIDVFRNQIIPYVQSLTTLPRPWVVMGQSMGGFNAAQLCAGAPDLWQKCVLLNSMMPSCDPFTGALAGGLNPIGGGFGYINICHPGPDAMVKDQFTPSEYSSYQPVETLKRAIQLPKTYVTACELDDFGLFTGPKSWSIQADALGHDIRWSPKTTDCDHYGWPVEEVVEFLTEPK